MPRAASVRGGLPAWTCAARRRRARSFARARDRSRRCRACGPPIQRGSSPTARSISRSTVCSRPMRSAGDSAIDAAATNCSTSSASVGGGSGGGGGAGSGALSDRSNRVMPTRDAQLRDHFVEHVERFAHFADAIAVVRGRPVGELLPRPFGGGQPRRADRRSCATSLSVFATSLLNAAKSASPRCGGVGGGADGFRVRSVRGQSTRCDGIVTGAVRPGRATAASASRRSRDRRGGPTRRSSTARGRPTGTRGNSTRLGRPALSRDRGRHCSSHDQNGGRRPKHWQHRDVVSSLPLSIRRI